MHTFNMKMKTNVQYIANATFAKLPDVGGNATKSDHLTKVEEINQILKIYHSEY